MFMIAEWSAVLDRESQTMGEAWIVANRAGLANTLSGLERKKLLEEVVQNAMDTNAKNIVVQLSKPSRGYSILTVEDDDPEGFVDMSLAYEMFADTPKRKDRQKRGRFTIGEKRVLAMSRFATIESTKGSVIFELKNGKEERTLSRKKREVGTLATFDIKMSEEEFNDVCAAVDAIIPDPLVRLVFNGHVVDHRKPILEFKAKLQTEAADATGQMKRFTEETDVCLYEPLKDETPMLYEMGIPVVETGDRWHVDVRQRVPLNSDRDNVPPSFLEAIRAFVLNHAHDMLTADEASESWVRLGAASDKIEKDAYNNIETKVHGEKKVIVDPNDPESAAQAAANGFTLIYGRTLTPGEFDNNRRFNTIPSSSSLFPTPRPYSENGPPVKIIPESEWTPGMRLVHQYSVALAKELMGKKLSVRFVNAPNNNFGACYGKDSGPFGPQMDFNIGRLGRNWFKDGITVRVDSLIIHEFGHQFGDNHLSEEYYEALSDLGAKLKALALGKPEFFAPFVKQEVPA